MLLSGVIIMKTKRLPSGFHETGNVLEVKKNEWRWRQHRSWVCRWWSATAVSHLSKTPPLCSRRHPWIIGRFIIRIHSALSLQRGIILMTVCSVTEPLYHFQNTPDSPCVSVGLFDIGLCVFSRQLERTSCNPSGALKSLPKSFGWFFYQLWIL